MPLPWKEVNRIDAILVAARLGLTPAREKRKWACPAPGCGSSDAFHTWPTPGRPSRCYSCQQRYTNVDLVALVHGTRPRDAVRWLAEQFGLHLETPPGTGGAARQLSLVPAPPPPPRPARPADPEGVPPGEVYAEILRRTTLTLRGYRYMENRGIPAGHAEAIGFRSVDGPEEWSTLRRFLEETYSPATLRAAGFPLTDGRVWLPFGGLLQMLLIPFLHGGRVVGLRARTIGPPPPRLIGRLSDWDAPHNRYRSLRDAVPSLPYNADALREGVVHLVEGELNALTIGLPRYGLHAVGLPGAGVWDDAWAALLGDAHRVVLWYDDDPAGRAARLRVETSLLAAHGAAWVAARLRHVRPRQDANDLHRAGELDPLVRSAAWMRAAA